MDKQIHNLIREIANEMSTIQKMTQIKTIKETISKMQVSFQNLLDREYELINKSTDTSLKSNRGDSL